MGAWANDHIFAVVVSLEMELDFSVKQILDRRQDRFEALHSRAPSGPVSICNRDNHEGENQYNVAALGAVFLAHCHSSDSGRELFNWIEQSLCPRIFGRKDD